MQGLIIRVTYILVNISKTIEINIYMFIFSQPEWNPIYKKSSYVLVSSTWCSFGILIADSNFFYYFSKDQEDKGGDFLLGSTDILCTKAVDSAYTPICLVLPWTYSSFFIVGRCGSNLPTLCEINEISHCLSHVLLQRWRRAYVVRKLHWLWTAWVNIFYNTADWTVPSIDSYKTLPYLYFNVHKVYTYSSNGRAYIRECDILVFCLEF